MSVSTNLLYDIIMHMNVSLVSRILTVKNALSMA